MTEFARTQVVALLSKTGHSVNGIHTNAREMNVSDDVHQYAVDAHNSVADWLRSHGYDDDDNDVFDAASLLAAARVRNGDAP